MSVVTVHVDPADIARITGNIENAIDDTVRLYAHNRLAAYCDPYTPKESGTLSQTYAATPEYLEYLTPYAHYQYEGVVYGRNIPIIQNGVIVGWFSLPGVKKHPTGRNLTYSKEVNPLATDHWDKAMLADRKDDFVGDIARFIMARMGGTK